MKYTLWLIPTEPSFGQYQNYIEELSKLYETHFFYPHITLLSGILADIDSIKKAISSIEVENNEIVLSTNGVGTLYQYFHRLYVLVSPTHMLLNLRQQLYNKLNMNERDEYMPHISLLYGNLSKHDTDVLVQKHQNEFDEPIVFDALWIVNTSGTPNEWVIVSEVKL